MNRSKIYLISKITFTVMFLQVALYPCHLLAQNLDDSTLNANGMYRRETFVHVTHGPDSGYVPPRFVTGFIYDIQTKKPIQKASLTIKKTRLTIQADRKGAYMFDLRNVPDSVQLVILQAGFTGYKAKEIIISRDAPSNTFYDIGLMSSCSIQNHSQGKKSKKTSKMQEKNINR